MAHTTLMYASDLHGSEGFFRKFVSAAVTYKAQVGIVGGAVTGKAQALESDPVRLNATFMGLMKERLNQWFELAEKHWKPKGIRFFFMAGNDDPFDIDAAINASGFVQNPDPRRYLLDDYHELVGLASANMTPWQCPRDVDDEALLAQLEKVMGLVESPAQAVGVFHARPYPRIAGLPADGTHADGQRRQ